MKAIFNARKCSKNEFSKLVFQRKYQIILILIVILPIAILISGQFTMQNVSYTVLSVATYFFLPLTAFMMASDLFAGEEEKNELKIMLTRPISRVSLVLGKLGAMLKYHSIILGILFSMSTVITILSVGWSSTNILSILVAYVITLLPGLTICGMAALIATLARTSTASFSICLVVYIGTIVLGYLFSPIQSALFTNYVSIYKMLIGTVVPIKGLLFGLAVLAGYFTLFMSAQIMIFEKKEV